MAIHGGDAFGLLEDGKPLVKTDPPAELPKPHPTRRRDLKNHTLDQDLYNRIRAAQQRDYPKAYTWDFAEWLLTTALEEYENAHKRKEVSNRMILTPADLGHRVQIITD